MTAPDLQPSLVEQMKEHGVDITAWDQAIYERLKQEMNVPGTSIISLQQPQDGQKLGIQRRGVYVKVLGTGTHVLYPKNLKEHEGCLCPTAFIMFNGSDEDVYAPAKRFLRDHFDLAADPGLVYSWPLGIWPDIKVQERIEYPIPFTYEAWPVSVELTADQFDSSEVLISKIDGSEWVWIHRPPKQ